MQRVYRATLVTVECAQGGARGEVVEDHCACGACVVGAVVGAVVGIVAGIAIIVFVGVGIGYPVWVAICLREETAFDVWCEG